MQVKRVKERLGQRRHASRADALNGAVSTNQKWPYHVESGMLIEKAHQFGQCSF